MYFAPGPAAQNVNYPSEMPHCVTGKGCSSLGNSLYSGRIS
jgi:hypothetical protein